jgi:hypothetical protein
MLKTNKYNGFNLNEVKTYNQYDDFNLNEKKSEIDSTKSKTKKDNADLDINSNIEKK